MTKHTPQEPYKNQNQTQETLLNTFLLLPIAAGTSGGAAAAAFGVFAAFADFRSGFGAGAGFAGGASRPVTRRRQSTLQTLDLVRRVG